MSSHAVGTVGGSKLCCGQKFKGRSLKHCVGSKFQWRPQSDNGVEIAYPQVKDDRRSVYPLERGRYLVRGMGPHMS